MEASQLGRLASAASSRLASLELGAKLSDLSSQLLRRPAEPSSPARAATSTASPPPAPLTPAARAARLRELLLAHQPIPLTKLARIVFAEGVPDVGGDSGLLRSLTWKLALGYLPADRSEWPPRLAQARELYFVWVRELTVDPAALLARAHEEEESGADHPLSTAEGSAWREWHADEELRREVRKDVDRTLPDYAFFNREQPLGRLHHAAISRVLFIYAKLNPGIRYVQGMNEVLAPIYFVFCKEQPEPSAEALDMIEADAFFCFTNLMAECRDHFCSKLDHTAVGIQHKVKEMERLIAKKDPELGRFLQRMKVSPTFYGFRWITLMMTQEFDLPDVMRLWDSLLTDPQRFSFLIYFCAAVVLSIRDELIAHNDFAFCVKALQRFDGRVPLEKLLAGAYEMYGQDNPSSTRR